MDEQDAREVKYDLACGQRKQPGFIGVDVVQTADVDIVWDLTQYPWPFASDQSCGEVHCSNFFEHLDGRQRMRFVRSAAPGF